MLRVAVMVVANSKKIPKGYARCIFLITETLVLLYIIVLLNKKMRKLDIGFLSGDFNRINNEFCSVLVSSIVQFSLNLYSIIEQDENKDKLF